MNKVKKRVNMYKNYIPTSTQLSETQSPFAPLVRGKKSPEQQPY